jgi:WD40 repeat protein
MAPEKADEGGAYMSSLLAAQRREYVGVMDATFDPAGAHLVCGGDDGRVAIWEVDPFMREDCWSSRTDAPDLSPDMSFGAEDGAINCIRFMSATGREEDERGHFLLVGADSQVSVWHWASLRDSMEIGSAPSPCTALLPLQLRGARGALHSRSEVNGLAVNKDRGHVVAACGDCRAHEWDLSTQSLTRTYSGHKGYLHCVQCVPSAGLTLTGGEDGMVGVWDSRMERSVDMFSPVERMASAGLGKCKQLKAAAAGSFVSSMQIDPAGNWLTCGGGLGGIAAPSSSAERGWIGLWHLPSRTVTSASTMTAAVHAMVYSDEYLITVGNEGYVSHWNWEALRLRSRTGATPPACYALAVNKHGHHQGITAVGGYSTSVDCYAYPGNISFSLAYQ